MGLFSLLFGAGIILFIERAETRATRPALLNLWRNALLLGIGILHTLLWDGDVLVVYAIAALFLIALRRLSARWLIAVGVFIFLLSVPAAFLMQYIANTTGAPLYGIWELADSATATPPGPAPETGYLLPGLTAAAYFARGLGHDTRCAGIYEPDYTLESAGRQLAETAPGRRRTDGIEQLSVPNRAGHPDAFRAAGRC